MTTAVERKAARKEASLTWQKEHSKPSSRANRFKLRDDDQKKIIPEHGRRGKGRTSPSDQPAHHAIKTSSAFSARLARGASVTLFWKRAEQIVGENVSNNPGALRAILDTNVLVAGLLAPQNEFGASRRLMELALKDGKVIPLVTWPIVDEYQRVCLSRDDLEFNRLCRLLSRSALISSSPAVVVPEVPDDPSDTPFLEALAQSMRGLTVDQRPPSELVTWDRHLLKMTAAEDLPELLRNRIVTPIEILWQLRRK